MSAVVLAESTAHWLTTAVEAPEAKSDHDSPIKPSPNPGPAPAVSQADSTATSALRPNSINSHASSLPSSLGELPAPRASSRCEYIGLLLSRTPCVARCNTVASDARARNARSDAPAFVSTRLFDAP